MPADGRVAGGKTVVRAGDRVPIRVSAFAGTHWAGFEHVTVYQGEPEHGGPVAGTALIRGIDAKTGGHGWFTWQAPTTPGTYTLVAQLQEQPQRRRARQQRGDGGDRGRRGADSCRTGASWAPSAAGRSRRRTGGAWGSGCPTRRVPFGRGCRQGVDTTAARWRRWRSGTSSRFAAHTVRTCAAEMR